MIFFRGEIFIIHYSLFIIHYEKRAIPSLFFLSLPLMNSGQIRIQAHIAHADNHLRFQTRNPYFRFKIYLFHNISFHYSLFTINYSLFTIHFPLCPLTLYSTPLRMIMSWPLRKTFSTVTCDGLSVTGSMSVGVFALSKIKRRRAGAYC